MALPGVLRLIGKRHVELVSNWMPSAAGYGATAGGVLLYFTDWKLVLQYLPFYNTKFKSEE